MYERFERIWSVLMSRLPAAPVASDHPSPTSNLASPRERAEQLLQAAIDFVPNSEFAEMAVESHGQINALLDASHRASDVPAGLPAHLQRMCEVELLTHDQEVTLFREMNLLKFRANALRAELQGDDVDQTKLAEIESLLSKARQVRDLIVRANMRLVMSIVKKSVTPQCSFDEMLSDGVVTLMQAVEKFDYARGFRFSTYAYRSIARTIYRSVAAVQKEQAKFARDAEDWAFESEVGSSVSSASDQVWDNVRELTASMLNQLDRRERFIVRCRYALGAHRTVSSFQSLADRLGISKERVRQLEQRAVNKLQAMAASYDMDELFSASMV